jgi:hypothetical protein
VARRERRHLRLDIPLHAIGERLSIEHPCAHAASVPWRARIRRTPDRSIIASPLLFAPEPERSTEASF